MDMKQCTRCKGTKTIEAFRKRKNSFRSWCRQCEYEAKIDRRRTNSEQYNAYQRNYYSRNPEKYADYRERYKEREHHYNVRRWKENKEHVSAITRRSYLKHHDQMIQRARTYRATQTDKFNESTIRYRMANPERVKMWRKRSEAKRRAHKLGNGGSFTVQEWIELCKRYNHRCLACGKDEPLTADHVVPLSKGGTSNIDNIQPLCKSCNSRKRDKTIDYRSGVV